MKRLLPLLALALVLAAAFTLCGGGDDDVPAATRPAPAGQFDMDRFVREIINVPPAGLITETHVVNPGIGAPVAEFILRTRYSTTPVAASDITLTLPFDGGESSAIVRNIAGDVYFLTTIPGEEHPWVKMAPDAESNDPLGGFGIANVLLDLSSDRFDPGRWAAAGEAACRDSQCFVLQNVDREDRRLHIDKETYAPVQLVLTRDDPAGQAPPVVIEIHGWGEPIEIEVPPGALTTATDAELEAAYLEVFLAAGVTE
jgi:hypothetical protein